MLKSCTLLLLMTITGTPVLLADAPVQATLAVEPVRTLPGLPVAFRVTVTNGSSSAIRLSRNAILIVEPQDGDVFRPLWGAGGGASPIGAIGTEEWTKISAGSVVSLMAPLDLTLSSPGWYFDRRLSKPGKYTVRLELEYLVTEEGEGANVLTSPAVIEVAVPAGVDRRVWSYMTQLAKSESWSSSDWWDHGFDVANYVTHCCMSSTYFPYVVVFISAPDVNARIEFVKRGIDAAPNGPMADLLRIGLASLLSDEAVRLAGAQDLKAALVRAQSAHETLSEVAARGGGYAPAARKALSELPDQDWLIDWAALRQRK